MSFRKARARYGCVFEAAGYACGMRDVLCPCGVQRCAGVSSCPECGSTLLAPPRPDASDDLCKGGWPGPVNRKVEAHGERCQLCGVDGEVLVSRRSHPRNRYSEPDTACFYCWGKLDAERLVRTIARYGWPACGVAVLGVLALFAWLVVR